MSPSSKICLGFDIIGWLFQITNLYIHDYTVLKIIINDRRFYSGPIAIHKNILCLYLNSPKQRVQIIKLYEFFVL
jgi:hypothetical protein